MQYHSLFLDSLASVLSYPALWLPLMLLFMYVLIRNNNLQELLWIFLFLFSTVVLANQGIYILQSYFSPDTLSKDMVILALNYHREGVGILASLIPAAPAMGIFLALLVRHRNLTLCLVAWSILNSWTRLYLSIVSPLEWGSEFVGQLLLGTLMYLLFMTWHKRINSPHLKRKHAVRTLTGYSEADIRLIILGHALTFLLIAFLAFL